MNHTSSRQILSALVILLAIAACATPGQTQTIQPTVALDSNAVATAVAGTAQAAAQQTASSELFAPRPTGATTEQLSDGATKYTDHDGGFEMIFPTGWLAVRPNSEEFDKVLSKQGASNSMLHDQMTSDLAAYDGNFDRLYSYVLRPDIKKNVIFGFSKLLWAPEDPTTIDSTQMGELVRGLEGPGGIPGYRADTVQLREDTPVKMIEIGGRFSLDDEEGGTIPFYATVIFFKPSPTSTTRMTFTFVEDYHAQIAADVQAIIASIKISAP